MAAKRQSIRVPGMSDGRLKETSIAPHPDGVRMGKMVFSSMLTPHDSDTNSLSEVPDEQAVSVFNNLRKFMEFAGGSPEDIAQMTVYIVDEQYRSSINKEWLKMFPDPEDRPSRLVLHREFPAGVRFELSVIAVLP